jgi:MFS family permease
VSGATPTASGLLVLPLTFGTIAASMITGRLISKTGKYKRWPLIGAPLTILGVALLTTIGPTTSRLTSGLFMAPLGLGIGMISPMVTLAAQNATDRLDTGTVTSLNTFFRTMGGTFGIALFGSVLDSKLRYWLPRELPAHASAHLSATSLAVSPAVVKHLPAPERLAVIQAFGHSLHAVFLWALPFTVLLFVAVLILKELPLRSAAHIANESSIADNRSIDEASVSMTTAE